MVQGVGFEPTYDFRRPGLQPGAINHSTTLAILKLIAKPDFLSQLANFQYYRRLVNLASLNGRFSI